MKRWEYRTLITAMMLILTALLVSTARLSNNKADAFPADVSQEKLAYDISDGSEKVVALTFDDGPKAGKTDVLLDGLKARGVRATFFMIGCQVADNEEIVERIFDEGHQIGIHTFTHIELDKLTQAKQKEEIETTEAAIEDVIGDYDFILRPPYGVVNKTLKKWIDMPMVLWSVDTQDWTGKDHTLVVKQTMKDVKDGDIILMHDIYDNSVEAALETIDELQKMGYTFLTVDEMFNVKGIPLEAGEVYHNAR